MPGFEKDGDLGYAANKYVFQIRDNLKLGTCKEAGFRAKHKSRHRAERSGKKARFRAEHRSSVPSKEEDGTARNLGIWAMQSIHVFRAAEIIGSSEHGDLGYAANTCVFRAAEIIGSSEPAWFAW